MNACRFTAAICTWEPHRRRVVINAMCKYQSVSRSQYLAVMEDRRGATLTDALADEPVIDQAEDRNEKGGTIYGTTSAMSVNLSKFHQETCTSR